MQGATGAGATAASGGSACGVSTGGGYRTMSEMRRPGMAMPVTPCSSVLKPPPRFLFSSTVYFRSRQVTVMGEKGSTEDVPGGVTSTTARSSAAAAPFSSPSAAGSSSSLVRLVPMLRSMYTLPSAMPDSQFMSTTKPNRKPTPPHFQPGSRLMFSFFRLSVP